MNITRIHRAVRFKETAWMAPIIQLNTDLLARVTPKSFEEEFLKLTNNSVFGKTMENLRKRIRVDNLKSN